VHIHDIIYIKVNIHGIQYIIVNIHKLIYNFLMEKKKPMSATERKQAERARKKEMGLIDRIVWAHPDDWPKIRELETELKDERFKIKDSEN